MHLRAGEIARVQDLVAAHGTDVFRVHRQHRERPSTASRELDFVCRSASVDMDYGADITFTESMLGDVSREGHQFEVLHVSTPPLTNPTGTR